MWFEGWRARSGLRKAQVVGAALGIAATPAVYLGAIVLSWIEVSHGPEGAMFLMWIALPLTAICRMFGVEHLLQVDPGARPAAALLILCLYTVTNSLLLFLIATLGGVVVTKLVGKRGGQKT
jgi:hypothetical protein